MDDPRIFGEFLDWGIANYPAERYALLLFDHGGSFYGFGGDDQDGLGGANALKPRAFRKEIQRSLDIAGVEKFDFINFFACLMGATEVLDAFDGLCDVFYGNPEIAWYYHIRGRLKYVDVLPPFFEHQIPADAIQFRPLTTAQYWHNRVSTLHYLPTGGETEP